MRGYSGYGDRTDCIIVLLDTHLSFCLPVCLVACLTLLLNGGYFNPNKRKNKKLTAMITNYNNRTNFIVGMKGRKGGKEGILREERNRDTELSHVSIINIIIISTYKYNPFSYSVYFVLRLKISTLPCGRFEHYEYPAVQPAWFPPEKHFRRTAPGTSRFYVAFFPAPVYLYGLYYYIVPLSVYLCKIDKRF